MTGIMAEGGRVQQLVDRARHGDRSAFDEIVRSFEAQLRSVVKRQIRKTRRADEEDVVQETFVLAFEAIGRFQWSGEAAFFSWLSRIAKNFIIDQGKDAARSRTIELPDQLLASGPSPSNGLRRDERLTRLELAMAKLPPEYREVLRLSRFDRLKVKEIAARMNRTEFAVKHLMARAVRRLKESFGDTESLHLPDRPTDIGGGERE